MNNNKRMIWSIWVLSVLVMVLVLVLLYVLVFVPTFNNYVIDKQFEAQNILVANMVSLIQSEGYVQIPLSENESLVLVPYVENQPPAQ